MFRVDLALRPERQLGPAGGLSLGDARGLPAGAGPRVGALRLAEEPRRRAARERRRAAARRRCASLVLPFVYRRYLDYGVFEALRALHRQMRDEAQRRSRRPARARQRRQAVARRHPRDRVHRAAAAGRARRPVPRDCAPARRCRRCKLAAGGLMQQATADALADGLRLPAPRRAPHPVPRRPADPRAACRPTTATSTGSPAAWAIGGDCGLRVPDQLGTRTANSSRSEFDTLLRDGRAPACNGCCRHLRPGAAAGDAEALARASCRRSCAARVGRSGAAAASAGCCATTASCAWPACIARAGAGGAAKARCTRRRRCASSTGSSRCCAAKATSPCWPSGPRCRTGCCACSALARWPMRYLMLHPGVIDELADERLLHDRFDAEAYKRELEERHARAGSASARPTRSCCSTPAAPRPSRRGVPHAGARRRGPHHGRAGRRRPLGARRRDALLRASRWAWKHLKPRTAPSRSSRSSPTASSAARSSATAATSTSSSSTTTPRPSPTRRPRSTAPSCASSSTG